MNAPGKAGSLAPRKPFLRYFSERSGHVNLISKYPPWSASCPLPPLGGRDVVLHISYSVFRWGDETALVNTDVRGRSYSPKGETPVAFTVGGTRHKLSMISTVTNRGHARWMIIDENFNAENLITFMQALTRNTPK